MAGQLHGILDSIFSPLREIPGKDKLESVGMKGRLQGALPSTVILLECDIETDH